MVHITPSRGIALVAASSALFLTACSGYGGGTRSSVIGTGTSGRTSVSSRSVTVTSSSAPRFSNFLSSSSSMRGTPSSSAPFFSMKRSSSSAAMRQPSVTDGTLSSPGAMRGEPLKLFIEADRGEAHPGDPVFYTVTLKNMTQMPLLNFPVSFSFSPSQLMVQEADGAVYPDRVEWTVDALQPGQKRGLRVRMLVSSTIQGGEIIRGNALAIIAGSAVSYSSPDIAIITEMPATGGGEFTAPLEDTTRFLRPL